MAVATYCCVQELVGLYGEGWFDQIVCIAYQIEPSAEVFWGECYG